MTCPACAVIYKPRAESSRISLQPDNYHRRSVITEIFSQALLFSSVLKINRKIRVSFTGLFGMGAMSMLCGIIPPTYIGWFFFAGGCICLGASGNVHTIPLTAYMQETISPDKMGRAFSVLTLISSVTMPAGLLFSSPIAEKVGVNVWFFISGLCMILLTASVSIHYSVKCRRKKKYIMFRGQKGF